MCLLTAIRVFFLVPPCSLPLFRRLDFKRQKVTCASFPLVCEHSFLYLQTQFVVFRGASVRPYSGPICLADLDLNCVDVRAWCASSARSMFSNVLFYSFDCIPTSLPNLAFGNPPPPTAPPQQVPAISALQWHPFTVSSCPEDPETSHHIKDMGPGTFTGKLRYVCTVPLRVCRVPSSGSHGDSARTTELLRARGSGDCGLCVESPLRKSNRILYQNGLVYFWTALCRRLFLSSGSPFQLDETAASKVCRHSLSLWKKT